MRPAVGGSAWFLLPVVLQESVVGWVQVEAGLSMVDKR